MSANNKPTIKTNITPHHCAPTSPQKQQENDFIPENEIVLIINELTPKTHETTGNKPEKPEMTNKPYMNSKSTPPTQPISCKS